jgi:hypothetical protein
VWEQLLEMARTNLSDTDLDDLIQVVLNGRSHAQTPSLMYRVDFGREIKNVIRSAQALAMAEGMALTMSHLQTVLKVQQKLKENFEGDPGLWNGMGVT